MAASDNVPILLKNRLHLAGRPQMSTRPKRISGIPRRTPPALSASLGGGRACLERAVTR